MINKIENPDDVDMEEGGQDEDKAAKSEIRDKPESSKVSHEL